MQNLLFLTKKGNVNEEQARERPERSHRAGEKITECIEIKKLLCIFWRKEIKGQCTNKNDDAERNKYPGKDREEPNPAVDKLNFCL